MLFPNKKQTTISRISSIAFACASLFATTWLILPTQVTAKTVVKLQCSDPDSKNDTSRNTVKIINPNLQIKKQTVATRTDLCISRTKVREYFCAYDQKNKNNYIAYSDILCGQGKMCVKGACVSTTKIEKQPQQSVTVVTPTTLELQPTSTPPTTLNTTPAPQSEPVMPKVETTTPVTPTSTQITNPLAQQPTAVTISILADSPGPNESLKQIITSGSTIGRFKIVNDGSIPVTINRITLTDNGTHWGMATFKLLYSDESSPNFNANIAESNVPNTDFSSLLNGGFTINGGSYRYISIALDDGSDLLSGDHFSLSVARLGDVSYSLHEIDWGHDANNNGTISDTIFNLPVNGQPYLGTIIKK